MFNKKILLAAFFAILSAVFERTSGYVIAYSEYDDSPACVMINSTNLRLSIPYQSKEGPKKQEVGVRGSDATDGSCSSIKPWVMAEEYPDYSALNSVKFTFDYQPKVDHVRMTISVTFDPSKLQDSIENNSFVTVQSVTPMILNGVNYSYHCNKSQVVQLTRGVMVKVDDLQMQAFHLVNSSFSSSNGSVCLPLPTTSTSKPSISSTKPSKPTSTARSTTKVGSPTASTSSTDTTATKVISTTSSTTSSPTTTATKHQTTTTKSTATTTGTKRPTTIGTKSTATTTETTSPGNTSMPTTTTNNSDTTTQEATTTHTPTTTHIITAAPTPVNNTFAVKDEHNKTCLLFRAAMALSLTYVRNDTNMTYVADVPKDAKLGDGSACDEEMEILVIEWSDSSVDVSLELEFEKSDNNFTMSAVSVNYTLMMASAPEFVVGNASASGLKRFSTSLDDHFMCSNNTNIPLGDGDSLEIKSVQIQGFRSEDKTDFYGSENNCWNPDAAKTTADTVVPIVVGVVLAALVVIVLIGYCIGRRRANRADEYDRL